MAPCMLSSKCPAFFHTPTHMSVTCAKFQYPSFDNYVWALVNHSVQFTLALAELQISYHNTFPCYKIMYNILWYKLPYYRQFFVFISFSNHNKKTTEIAGKFHWITYTARGIMRSLSWAVCFCWEGVCLCWGRGSLSYFSVQVVCELLLLPLGIQWMSYIESKFSWERQRRVPCKKYRFSYTHTHTHLHTLACFVCLPLFEWLFKNKCKFSNSIHLRSYSRSVEKCSEKCCRVWSVYSHYHQIT